MKKVELPYLYYKAIKGRTYIYFRRGKLLHRLPDDPDSQEFSTEYWAVRNGKKKAPTRTTWAKLVESYYRSPEFQRLGKGTKANYRRHCDAVLAKNAAKDMRNFRRRDAIAIRDALQDSWSKANERVSVISTLCRHAVDLEWIERNPVVDVAKLKGGEYRAWPDEKLKAYEGYCDKHGLTVARTIYELAIGTGQRLGDCIAMKWSSFDGEFMSVTQEKTRTPLQIYCPERLQNYLASLPREGAYILAKNLRQPLTKSTVQKAVQPVQTALEVKGGPDRLVIHGWRYTAAKQLADAGNAISDIQAVTGHKTYEMAKKYTQQADQRIASKRAQKLRERTGGEQ